MLNARTGRRALGTLAAAAILTRSVGAQTAPRVLALSWGGGVDKTWQEAFAKPYQQRSGTPVSIRQASDPTAQIRAQAASPQYNVFVGTYTDAVNMHRDGLIETFDQAELPHVATVEPGSRLVTPEGRLLGVPVYFTYYGIAQNTQLVQPGRMNSWTDLTDQSLHKKVAYARPVYASIYDLTVLAYAAGGNERNIEGGVELFRRVAANAMTAFSSLAQANQLISRGEIAAAPYYASRTWAMKEDGLPVDMVIPRERALMLPYIAMVPKGTFDIATAKGFLNFLLEPEPQLRITELSGYLSPVKGAKLTPALDQRLGMPLADLKSKLIQPDWFYLAGEQRRRADLVEQIVASVASR